MVITVSGNSAFEKPVQIGRAIRVTRLRKNMEAVFQCSCGVRFICAIASVKYGATASCGCYSRKITSIRTRTHGKSKSKIYHVWHNMMRRCHDESNKRYNDWGGRGIVVDSKWHDFAAFFIDVGDVPFAGAQIDRIDNHKSYEPGNIRWVTHTENNANTRRSRFVMMGDRKYCVAEAARIIGMTRYRLRDLLNQGNPPSVVIEVIE